MKKSLRSTLRYKIEFQGVIPRQYCCYTGAAALIPSDQYRPEGALCFWLAVE